MRLVFSTTKEMNTIPKHIAIIMDGNGRWAKEKGLPRAEGHRKGVEAVEEIVESCSDIGVKHLTLYAFSDENWQRPDSEVEALMKLLSFFVKSKEEKMIENNIRLRTIGDISKLPPEVFQDLDGVKRNTEKCNGMDLVLALSYGSHSELARAFSCLIEKGKKDVTPEDIQECLDTSWMPDPDLLIRTSGEFRLSNFLLWQLAYTELYFTEVFWPEFDKSELMKAIEDFKKRERRFGSLGEDI